MTDIPLYPIFLLETRRMLVVWNRAMPRHQHVNCTKLGIDIAAVPGSGRSGCVTMDDVIATVKARMQKVISRRRQYRQKTEGASMARS